MVPNPRCPWFFHGAALAVLPWLHTRFALLAGSIGALVVLDLARTRNPAGKASAFLAVPSVSALAWIGFFIAVYGTPDPAIPYRGSDLGSPSYIVGGLGGLFFDQMYGLFVNAPVLIAAPLGMLVLASRAGFQRRLSAQLAFIALPYVLTVTHFAMWWGGFSSPARFLVPLLPSLAIPIAVAWASLRERSVRIVFAGGLAVTACLSTLLVTVDRGRLAVLRSRQRVRAVDGVGEPDGRSLPRASIVFRARAASAAGRPVLRRSCCLAVRHRIGSPRRPRGRAPRTGPVARQSGDVCRCRDGVRRDDRRHRRLEARGCRREVARIGRHEPAEAGRRRRTASWRWTSLAGGCSRAPMLVRRTELRLARGAASGRRAAGRSRAVHAPGDAGRRISAARRSRGRQRVVDGRDRSGPRPVRAGDRTGRGVRSRRRDPVSGRCSRAGRARRRGCRARTSRSLFVRPVSIRSRSEKVADGLARRAVRYGNAIAFFMDERSFPGARRDSGWAARASPPSCCSRTSRGSSLPLQVRNAPSTTSSIARERRVERNAAACAG